jgi:hypothetical protein
MVIWNIFPVSVCCTKKILATLLQFCRVKRTAPKNEEHPKMKNKTKEKK